MSQRMKNRCIVTLKKDDFEASKTYRINERLFYMLEKNLEKYRSESPKAKKIRCIETDMVFDSARKASEWVEFVLEISYCDFMLIKAACNRKNGKSYGYHWEFVKEQNSKTQ